MIRFDKQNEFSSTYETAARELLRTTPVDRGSWQSGAAPSPVYELEDAIFHFEVPALPRLWEQEIYGPSDERDDFVNLNRQWAEDHFQERVSGQPLNPAPSYLNWPWHSEKYREQYKGVGWKNRHNRQTPFDHTYPERMWPKLTDGTPEFPQPMSGIRFDYGDLKDVIDLLKRDPFTRQAYLPIWFPEDTGSASGQRVPCTLGYHFIRYGARLNIKYFIRSCDLTRHLTNDVYMAGRLLQYVALHLEGARSSHMGLPLVGDLTMFVSNLHMFTADAWRYERTV
ncbi:thymidylate synthase [Gordonia phage Biskit]|uniref:Thymidylate synthase n=1 Tax=Gordonia phage SketchMex TaxID=2250418 RepID=A0A345KQ46_9CAUD|nr:thymidylate synthase [Gordonia phage SketchMex]UVK62089.1 thymidylate synthase [Gordonia phage Biskit]